MKSLVKKLANSTYGVMLRNYFNFHPVNFINQKYAKFPITISDAFLWRTDNGYTTKFKYSDILKLFYKVKNSWVEFHFYSKNNELIKIKKVNNLDLSNELEINSKYLNNLEDYGVFYIFHFTEDSENFNNNDIISNRCYLGYAQNNNLYSFVHGNSYVKFTNINDGKHILGDIQKISFFKNQIYTIQKHFGGFDKNELLFTNPSSKMVKFSIENKTFKIKPYCTILTRVSGSIISIKSNCLFFRPTVFSYKGKYMDVHHS